MINNQDVIIEILNLEDEDVSLSRDQSIEEYNFDSLAMVMLITRISDEFNVDCDPDSIKVNTIGELDDFISSFK